MPDFMYYSVLIRSLGHIQYIMIIIILTSPGFSNLHHGILHGLLHLYRNHAHGPIDQQPLSGIILPFGVITHQILSLSPDRLLT